MDLASNCEQLDVILDCLAAELNISETMSEKAVRAYSALGEWLEGNDDGISTDVYPQGSFALGTVVRPVSGDDNEYDIDLVCQMPDLVFALPEEIKRVVGDRLKQHGTYAEKLEEEGKRCWTLQYDEFHVDVLPCTDEINGSQTSIRLTHRDPASKLYESRFSDPRGYKEWFEDRMGDVLVRAKAERSGVGKAFASIDEVPTYMVRTPLQKAVQILKFHRDVMFSERDDAPISIILTTLAAWSYKGELGTYEALMGILEYMDRYISGSTGCYKISNPSNPKENFADRWNEQPRKADAFFDWLKQARSDFGGLADTRGLDLIGRSLERSMGEVVAKRALVSYGKRLHDARDAGSLLVSSAGLSMNSAKAPMVVPRHEFYGE